MVRSRYDEDPEFFDLMAEGLAREGKLDGEIATVFGVSEKTFRVWKKNYVSLAAALKIGKAPVDYNVENSLLKLARGFEVEETKIIDSDVDGKRTVRKETTRKYVPPSATACALWLKTRLPERWGEKKGLDNNSEVPIKELFESLKKGKKKE